MTLEISRSDAVTLCKHPPRSEDVSGSLEGVIIPQIGIRPAWPDRSAGQ